MPLSRNELVLILVGLCLLVLIPLALHTPKEEVALVPEVAVEEERLETYTDSTLSFKYPKELPTTYIRVAEWPPKILRGEAFACEEGETEIGATREERINGKIYCVTSISEGAAGSTYTEYTYRTQDARGPLTLNFTLRSVQCGNYNEPERGACEAERAAFSTDALAAQIAESVTWGTGE
ncbi:MAG TPA: hypothetical protein VGB97_03850 [Candidatus Paceibacterota bacterium]|jgi:hypothetical protein